MSFGMHLRSRVQQWQQREQGLPNEEPSNRLTMAVVFNLSPYFALHSVRCRLIGQKYYLTDGWQEMIRFYGLKSYYWFVLNYIGGSKFKFVIFNMYAKQISYHPCSSKDEKLVDCCKDVCGRSSPSTFLQSNSGSPCFKITLSHYKANGSQLSLPKDMAAHILKCGTHPWDLRCPTGIKVTCVILAREKNYAKFGRGWKKLCRDHSLKEYDECIFKVVDDSERTLDVSFVRA